MFDSGGDGGIGDEEQSAVKEDIEVADVEIGGNRLGGD